MFVKKESRIVVMIGKEYHVYNEAKYQLLLNSGADFKLIGSVNESLMGRLNTRQKEALKDAFKRNIEYLANKSPDQLIKNFRDSVLREV